MSLVRSRFAMLLLAPLCVTLVTSTASAKKKKGSPPASGGDMTFEPEAVDHPAEAPAETPPPKAKTRAKAVRVAPSGPAGPASKTLERALKLYDAQDYPMASIELNKVIEGQSGDDEANKQRAEFFMGKALFNLKYYSASLSYFDRIVQKGPAHRYYAKTLQWLASLSRFLPESAGVLEKIGKYTRADRRRRRSSAASSSTNRTTTRCRRSSSTRSSKARPATTSPTNNAPSSTWARRCST